MSPYSSRDLIKTKYICSKDLRSNLSFKRLIIFILVHAFSVIQLICLCQVQSFERYRSKCLCESTSVIW